MKRTGPLLLIAFFWISAQSQRDAYRSAFQAWRQTEPSLERDASTAGSGLNSRADKAASAETAFAAARSLVLRSTAEDAQQRLLWLRASTTQPSPDVVHRDELMKYVESESRAVAASINSYAKDPDRGIQQLRQSLDKERAALAALSAVMIDRDRAADKASQAAKDLSTARALAADQYAVIADGLSGSARSIDQEHAAWASYYQSLADGARTAALASPSPPVPTPAPAAPSPAPRPASITGVPLARYTGDWQLPSVNAMFHGAPPESVDLTVREVNGHITGSMVTKFKVAAGVSGNSEVRFTFEGDLQPGRIQSFPLTMSDGAKGAVDLIPGPAFNLLEVSFQTDLQSGSVRAGNFILVKK